MIFKVGNYKNDLLVVMYPILTSFALLVKTHFSYSCCLNFPKFQLVLKTSKGKTRGFGRLFWNLPDTSQQFKILSRLNFWLELALIWAELALWPGSKAELIWLYN